MAISISYGHIYILWLYLYLMDIATSYGFICILWTYLHLTDIYPSYGHISILWLYLHLMDISTSYGHIYILWMYLHLMDISVSYGGIYLIPPLVCLCPLSLSHTTACCSWAVWISVAPETLLWACSGPRASLGSSRCWLKIPRNQLPRSSPWPRRERQSLTNTLFSFLLEETTQRQRLWVIFQKPSEGTGSRQPLWSCVPKRTLSGLSRPALFPSVTLIAAPWDSLLGILFKSLPQKSTLGNYNPK